MASGEGVGLRGGLRPVVCWLMRFLMLGLIVLPLAACNLRIGEETDGASGTGTEATIASGTGEPPTTSEGPVTGGDSGSSGPGSTGEATGSSGDASGASDESGGTATGGGVDMGGAKFGDATVDDSCAPDDGPALEFRLRLPAAVCGTDWSGDVVRAMLFQGGPLAPGDYPLGGGAGFGWWQQGDLPPESSSEGTITIDSWEGDMVTGSYTLTFAGAVLEGEFAGPRCPPDGLCG